VFFTDSEFAAQLMRQKQVIECVIQSVNGSVYFYFDILMTD